MDVKELVKKGLQILPDDLYLRALYLVKIHRPLRLNHPQTFNEKLQWLKLHNRNPEFTRMVDKFEAKAYVAERIGEEYIIPTLGVWDRFDEIDFDALPDRFVLKCTHDSGGLVICRDKSTLDFAAARDKIEACLKRNYYWEYREWPYKDVKPRIIAEEYLPGENGELLDYKFMCFNGEMKSCMVCSQRQSGNGLHVDNYDIQWKKQPFERGYPSTDMEQPKPEHFDTMVAMAEELAKDLPFIRVDFYENGGRVYFGELTFFPGSGVARFNPPEWDAILGSWIQLPEQDEKKF